MKIKHISCTQFAGIRDQDVALEDGINVIYGKNESGKSTLVNLLSRTLFQEARLDGRSDKGKGFRKLYFPSARRGSSVTADFMDGKISFETDAGTYTVTKEWGAEPRCMLSTPDGIIREQKNIDKVLREVLLYGEGVYSDMLFSSQHNTDLSLQTILDAARKTDAKQELTTAVSNAFAESGGISLDEIEQAIAGKIEDLAGRHWDSARAKPASKAGRWSNSLGEVLKAYYALEDAQRVLEKISALEAEADQCAAAYTQQDAAARQAEEAYNQFERFSSRLVVQSEKRKAVSRLEADCQKYAKVLAEWPKLTAALEKARALQAEKESRRLLDQYGSVKSIQDELEQLDPALITAACPTREEIQAVKTAQNQVSSLQNKLCGMKLTASLNMLDGGKAEVKSLRTGQAIDVFGEQFAITEAVQITIPGVMELQLAPANVNVAEIQAKIADKRKGIRKVLESYQVDGLDALEELAQKIGDTRHQADSISTRLTAALGASSFQEVETAASGVTGPVRSGEAIGTDLFSLCGSGDAAQFIAAKESLVEGYQREYGSVEALKARAYETGMELKQAKEVVESANDIPEEYRDLADPEDFRNGLKARREAAQSAKEDALAKKAAAAKNLETYQDSIPGDPTEELEKARRIFEERRALLAHWQHIAQVFAAEKERIASSPMQDIADSFAMYLSVISDGGISSEFPAADKLNVNVYSHDRLLDYGKLSEGTKDTVSLAFRLAVLEHLFPEGGGVIVLDDPLTDMDAERAAQSCALIRECSKRHQVLFLTCREDYLNALGGNLIRFEYE